MTAQNLRPERLLTPGMSQTGRRPYRGVTAVRPLPATTGDQTMTTRLHRSEVDRQLSRLRYAHGIKVSRRQVETHLGYPLAEAGFDDLRGVIAGLAAVYESVEETRRYEAGAEGSRAFFDAIGDNQLRETRGEATR